MDKLTIGEEFVRKYVMVIREQTGSERHLFIIPKPGLSTNDLNKYLTSAGPKGGYVEIEMASNKYVALHIKKRFVDMIRSYDDYRRIYFHLSVWFNKESVKSWFPKVASEVKKILDKKRSATIENNINRVNNLDAKEISSLTKNKSVKACAVEQRKLERDTTTPEEVLDAPKEKI